MKNKSDYLDTNLRAGKRFLQRQHLRKFRKALVAQHNKEFLAKSLPLFVHATERRSKQRKLAS